jgi:hypothetical protein
MLALFGTALLLGVAGSLHCVGMCGPLMLALPLPADSKTHAFLQALGYQAGRIATYVSLGLVFGLLGKGLSVAGFQQSLSVFAGILLLIAAFFSLQWESTLLNLPGTQKALTWLRLSIARLLRERPSGAVWGLGMLNGLLPCGLVYAAAAGAIAAADVWQGAGFMLFFGAGTLPLPLLLMLGAGKLSLNWRRRLRFMQPFLMVAAGLLLLYRGFNLDLSLFESAVPPANMDCH